ncbi:MAG: tetratricopeptide repeat protein [Planctomycetota bacterium]
MRFLSVILLLVACAAGSFSSAAVSLAERTAPHDVDLEQLVRNPQAYEGMRVRFNATFVQTAGLFDPYHTRFTPERSINMVVWDDQAAIWKPTVRSKPVVTLYYDKNRKGAKAVSSLDKYTVITVIGQVQSSFRGQPWIDCHSLERAKVVGTFTDNAVYHLEQGLALAEAGEHELADENLRRALSEDLPLYAQAAVHRMRGRNLLAAERCADAADVLATALELLAANPEIDRDRLPVLHYLRAKAVNELAEQAVAHGDSATAQQRFAEAVEHARAAVRLDPSVGDAYAVLGIGLAGLEQWEEAKRQCARAIRMLPGNAEIRWYLGRIQNRQGAHDQSIATLKKGIDLAPKDYRLHKAIARAYFKRHLAGGGDASGDLVTALREYDIAIRLYPEDPDLYYYSGVVIERAADFDAKVRLGTSDEMVPATYPMAVERFEQCLAVEETYTEAHLRLGRRYRAVEDHDKAAAHYMRTLELEPDREELYAEVGRYLWDLGKREQAYDIYLAFHERQSEHIDTLYALGRLSLELEQWARSIEWHERLLYVSRQHTRAHVDLTQASYENDDSRDAISYGEDALELAEDPELVKRVHHYKGLAHWELDQEPEVIEHLDQVVVGTQDIRVPLALGWCLSADIELGPRVVELARQALAIEPDNSRAQEMLGWGQVMVGDYFKAEATLKAAGIKDEERLAYRLGLAVFKQGPQRYEEAKSLLEVGEDFRGRRDYLDDARRQVRAAQRSIRDYERKVKRLQREERRRREREARSQGG